MSEAEWERHNESFRYEPPSDDPEQWSAEDYDELHDRIIGRSVEWHCQKCNRSYSALKYARRHVERHHSAELLEQVTADD